MRVVRILIYEGREDEIKHTLANGYIKEEGGAVSVKGLKIVEILRIHEQTNEKGTNNE